MRGQTVRVRTTTTTPPRTLRANKTLLRGALCTRMIVLSSPQPPCHDFDFDCALAVGLGLGGRRGGAGIEALHRLGDHALGVAVVQVAF
jgi:hypothetical protein